MSEEDKPAEPASAETQNLENAKALPKPRARRTTRAKKVAADAAAPVESSKSKVESPATGRDAPPARPSEPAAPVESSKSKVESPAPGRDAPTARPSESTEPSVPVGSPKSKVESPAPGRDAPTARPSEPAPVAPAVPTNDATTERRNGSTEERSNGPTVERSNGPTVERSNGPTEERSNDAPPEPQSPRDERLAKWGRFPRRGRFRDRRNRFHNDMQQGQPDGQAQSPENGDMPQEERPQLPPLKLWELEGMSLEALNEKLEGFFTPEELAGTYRKHDVINDFIRAYMRRGGTVITNGVIEIMSDGFGFLRSEKSSYLACPEDVYVAPNYVRRFNLRTGDFVEGPIRDPRERPERGKEKFLALGRIETVNGRPPAEWRRIIPFENLTPIFPTRRIQLERISSGHEPTDISMRFVDLFAPIGFGQRGLIVAPPRTGKTVLLQKVANAITANYPDAYLIVLLIDERPEEVTDMERNTKAHVLSSTFDEAPERHAQVSEMAIEMAKRKVESGADVVILLDSITRLARAYNTLAPHSGKILSGGVDANAMFKPKRFFGAARNIEGGGSLTIIATALIETGSRMDEVIFEEFKGTGNMELVLDRQLSDRRIFPAINVGLSGTRKEELIVSPPELNLARNLRKMLADSPTPLDSMDNIIKHMKKFNSNLDLMMQKFNS